MNFEEFKKTYQKKEVTEYPNKVSSQPLVSVCVQTYNQVNFISDCLEGILMQEIDFEVEILVGDDASNDGTREICLDFAKKYPEKIRLFFHKRENNIKVGENSTALFNSLFNFFSARGKYIAYCDGDDYWQDPLKLKKQVAFLEKNPEYVLSYHRAIFVDLEDSRVDDNGYSKLSQRDFSSLELQKVIVQPIISTWCFRNVITEIPEEITHTMIADNFWISLLGSFGSGKYLAGIEPSKYRIHREGIWSLVSPDVKFASKMVTYKNLSRYYLKRKEAELASYFRKRSRNYFKMLLVYNIKKFDLNKAVQSVFSYWTNSLPKK